LQYPVIHGICPTRKVKLPLLSPACGDALLPRAESRATNSTNINFDRGRLELAQ
jgi:hypothetical protein